MWVINRQVLQTYYIVPFALYLNKSSCSALSVRTAVLNTWFLSFADAIILVSFRKKEHLYHWWSREFLIKVCRLRNTNFQRFSEIDSVPRIQETNNFHIGSCYMLYSMTHKTAVSISLQAVLCNRYVSYYFLKKLAYACVGLRISYKSVIFAYCYGIPMPHHGWDHVLIHIIIYTH